MYSNGVYVDAATVLTKRADGPNPLSGFRPLHPDSTTCSFFCFAFDTGVVCVGVLLSKKTKDVSVLAGAIRKSLIMTRISVR